MTTGLPHPTPVGPAPRRRARPATALAGAALVAGALLIGSGSATAAPASGLVGTWSATVNRQGITNTATFVFTASGRFCLRTEASDGAGRYVSRGDYLAYQADEKLRDPATGAPAGTVKVNQVGRQQGASLSSQGLSIVYDVAGKRTGQVVSKVTATRTSTSTSGC